MKLRFIGFLVVVAIALIAWKLLIVNFGQNEVAAQSESAMLATLQGSGLPLLQLEDLYGVKTSTSHFKGKVLLVHFWATWCGPCVSELPLLGQLSNVSRDVDIVAISGDSQKKDIDSFLLAFPELKRARIFFGLDLTSSLAHQFYVDKLPETFIFDSNRKLVKRIIGATDWSSSEVREYLGTLMPETGSQNDVSNLKKHKMKIPNETE